MDAKHFTIINSVSNSDTLIVAFSGYGTIGNGTKFDFYNLLTKHFNTADLQFYCDDKMNCYNYGVADISHDIESTVDHFRPIVDKYKNTIFLGNSSGGYASILYGSLLGVKSVIAFNAPTNLYGHIGEHVETKPHEQQYRDIKNHINQNTTYYLFGDLSVLDESHPHHPSHCLHINNYPNVNVVLKEHINLPLMRDNGELFDIINRVYSN